MTKKGFTLPEVLITLCVIGVVAAISMPAVINNVQREQFRAKFKKDISLLNQAITMNKAKYDWDFADITACNNSKSDNPDTYKSVCSVINGSLKGEYVNYIINYPDDEIDTFEGDYKFMAVTRNGALFVPTDYNVSEGGIQYLLPDGSLFMTIGQYAECTKTNKCLALIDVNGIKPPNKEAKCSQGNNKSIDNPNCQDCTVKNNKENLTDIYPVYFYDSIVEPATNAGVAVLTNVK
ncbi:type II secretion system protein [bacterium]|nr:type II secretion system protein [bacterium]